MRVTIDLDNEDLKHFRLVMKEARSHALRLSPDEIVASAGRLLASVGKEKVPRFVRERLERLELMIRMLTDHEWRLPQKDTSRVLNALAYFTEPEDLIPDHVPGIGYLDDAIMIELVVRDLKHEIEAYQDFCDFRRTGPPARGVKHKSSDLTRERWLEKRRKALLDRMKRRRESEQRRVL
jgi:uncharacterized membrane protein YkvA (DUF1232 family)